MCKRPNLVWRGGAVAARCVFALVAVLAALESSAAADEWRYVLPPVGDPMESPPPRAVVLSDQKPEGIKETAEYRGQRRRYVQISYGSSDSTPVTLVLDEVSSKEVDLYADANRNLIIQPEERMEGSGRTWRMPVQVALPEGGPAAFVKRTLLLRLGASGRTLGVAAAGYLEGTAQIGERECTVRRVDGDANGFLADSQDRLWIDLNGDGQWEAAGELFLFAPILSLGGTRYAVRSDVAGTRLAFEPVTGVASVTLQGKAADPASRITELIASMIGRDGSAISLRAGQTREIPAGEYRFSTVLVSLSDPKGGLPWVFVFSERGGESEARWLELGAGASLQLDPLGRVSLQPRISGAAGAHRAGDWLDAFPCVETGDGLHITAACRGALLPCGQPGGLVGRVALLTTDGRLLGEGQAGFA